MLLRYYYHYHHSFGEVASALREQISDLDARWTQSHLQYVSRLQGKTFISHDSIATAEDQAGESKEARRNKKQDDGKGHEDEEHKGEGNWINDGWGISHEHFLKLVETTFNLLGRRSKTAVSKTYQYTTASHQYQMLPKVRRDACLYVNKAKL